MIDQGSRPTGRLMELTGPRDYIDELSRLIEAAVQPNFRFSVSKQPGIGGTDALKLILDITEVSVQIVSIYLAGHHIARESIRIKKNGKTVDVSKSDNPDVIAQSIEE